MQAANFMSCSAAGPRPARRACGNFAKQPEYAGGWLGIRGSGSDFKLVGAFQSVNWGNAFESLPGALVRSCGKQHILRLSQKKMDKAFILMRARGPDHVRMPVAFLQAHGAVGFPSRV